MKTQAIHFHPKAHPKSETFKANASDALADAPLRIVTVRGSGYLLEAIDGTPDAEG